MHTLTMVAYFAYLIKIKLKAMKNSHSCHIFAVKLKVSADFVSISKERASENGQYGLIQPQLSPLARP